MKPISAPFLPLLAVFALVTPTLAWWRGYNFKSYTEDGVTCKALSDWTYDFAAVKQLPNSINAARLFYSHECDTLANAVPAALAAGLHILVGLDDTDSNFENEKGALLAAVSDYGWDWIAAISVGSESLYRGAIEPADLAAKIYDVRGMLEALSSYPGGIEVGHVDTTEVWFQTSNSAVTIACDFIGVDIYPYFQTETDNHIDNAKTLFDNNLSQAQATLEALGSDASIWVTETGWPVAGSQLGNAVPGVSQAASYFQQVGCSSFGAMNTFWFTFQEWNAEPSFAVVNSDGMGYYSQDCP